jgi:hypothetical protein
MAAHCLICGLLGIICQVKTLGDLSMELASKLARGPFDLVSRRAALQRGMLDAMNPRRT